MAMTSKERDDFKALAIACVQYERMLVASFEERVLLRQREENLLQQIKEVEHA